MEKWGYTSHAARFARLDFARTCSSGCDHRRIEILASNVQQHLGHPTFRFLISQFTSASISMHPPHDQSHSTFPELFTFTTILKLVLILAISTIATYLTIRSSSEPGGILYGARVWSRNYLYTRANPRPPKGQGPPDFEDDNSEDDVPYGAPGLFDDQTSSAAQANCNGEDVAGNDGHDSEDDVPYGSGLFDRPLPGSQAERSCESPYSDA